MRNQKKIISLVFSFSFIITGCSSTKYIAGQVYSDADYQIMGKGVSFSKYGLESLNRHTKEVVSRNRNKLTQAVDSLFLEENGKFKTDGILELYSRNY